MLSTEFFEIQAGAEWQKISTNGGTFDVQNRTNILIEYTFTNGVDVGSILLPHAWVTGLVEDIYFRMDEDDVKGTISIVRSDA